MDKIEIIQNGDVYSCHIGISKEEWLSLLKDGNMPIQYKEALVKFYYMPEQRGSCTAVCNAMGGDAQSLNLYIAKCGEFVQKRLNRFQIIRPNGKPCFWLVPMCEGKDLPAGSEGTFEWQLRPELTEAIKDYLYWHLVECYKEVRKEIRIDDDKWDELYKWKLITDCQGKDNISIVERVRVTNLIYTALVSPTLDFVIKSRRDDFDRALTNLSDSHKPLLERIRDYNSTMKTIANDPNNNKQNLFAEDERTASAILTCIEPNTYTIYKFDVYKEVCRYLHINTKPTGQCYAHFMELIKPLLEIVKNDEKLQELVAPSLKNVMKCDLLLAQDVLWVLFASFPQKIGFIYPILHPNIQRVWLWGEKFLPEEKNILRCGSSAKAIKDFRIFKSKNALRKAYQEDVGNQDTKIPDAYWNFTKEVKVGDIVVVFEAKKEGDGEHQSPNKQYHLLHGWGVFTSDCMLDEADENPMYREVEWHLPFFKEPKRTNVKKDSLFFQGTNAKQAQQIKELLNIDTDKKMEQKYAKYIDLLKETHNLVLTGAPGTGKTYMAQEIAKEMKAVTKFVQFHPSYDYTDFVEGLRPVEKEDGQMGFERKDGVFKEFCKKAIEGEPSVSSPTCHVSFDDAYDAFIKYLKEAKKELTFERPRSEPFIVTVGDDSQLRINGNSIKKELVKRFYEHASSSNWYSKHSELIIDYLYDHFHLDKVASIDSQEDKKYVFIIDEINRGEVSKIFGELFYAIDPGYRGKKDCMVQTQYQNLVPETDVFAKGFYVPENVYILATMNDIDRSVESMDFAMRRRFTWKEVTPSETASMLDTLPCAKEAKAAMTQLNQVIAETDGLGAAYQIGPSYFLKLEKNGGDFDKLWEMNIEPLLKEYLRGFRKASEILGKFKTAFFGANEVTANDNTEPKDED